MYNDSCMQAIMRYLENNLIPDSRGKIAGIKARHIAEALEESFPSGVVYLSLEQLYSLKFIKKTNPESVQRANVYKINGITPAGYEYLSFIKNDTFSNKLKSHFSLENILNSFSLGKTVWELLQKLP